MDKKEITDFFKQLQDNICSALEKEDGKACFEEDLWNREGGGGGKTRILQNGNVIEKGGVNFSAVHGNLQDSLVKALGIEVSGFFASGVSIVMHPSNPMVPIIHMNVRYFELENGTKWFGGGIDLTPHYVNKNDASFFHNELKKSCDKHDNSYYPSFKKWADDYFFIKHRNETRGIGGIFFDKLSESEGKSLNDIFEFVKSVGNTFAPTYLELIKRNKDKSFTEKEKQWQYIRRGRYVEFNLVYDRGTKFGLETDGRTESILMSLPPQANWIYNFTPEKHSEEEKTLNYLKKGIEWI